MSPVLPKACVCGHDHVTHRGEPVTLCLDCQCVEEVPRCQNCGGEASPEVLTLGFDACSRRCALQLEFAASWKAAA